MQFLYVVWTGVRRLLRPASVALLVGAILAVAFFTLVWLIQPESWLGVTVASFTYLALPAVLIALLLLPIVAVKSRGFALPAACAVALLPLVVLQVVHFGPLFVGGTSRTAADVATVMTVNAHRGEADADDIVRLVRDRDVDLLTVLEITPALRSALDDAGIDDLLPYREDNLWRESSGRITYSDLPLREEAVIQQTPLWGHVLAVGEGESAFTYVAVHISRPLRDSAKPWLRAHAALRERLSAMSGPVVVAGDFGATSDHAPMRRLAGDGFDDAVVVTDGGFEPTWPAPGSHALLGIPLPALIQIDHVLGNKAVEFHSSAAVTVDGADHKAVIARFGIVE